MKRPPHTTYARLLQVGDEIANTWAYYVVTDIYVTDTKVAVEVDVRGGGENYPKHLRVFYSPDERVELGRQSARIVEYRRQQREEYLRKQASL